MNISCDVHEIFPQKNGYKNMNYIRFTVENLYNDTHRASKMHAVVFELSIGHSL